MSGGLAVCNGIRSMTLVELLLILGLRWGMGVLLLMGFAELLRLSMCQGSSLPRLLLMGLVELLRLSMCQGSSFRRLLLLLPQLSLLFYLFQVLHPLLLLELLPLILLLLLLHLDLLLVQLQLHLPLFVHLLLLRWPRHRFPPHHLHLSRHSLPLIVLRLHPSSLCCKRPTTAEHIPVVGPPIRIPDPGSNMTIELVQLRNQTWVHSSKGGVIRHRLQRLVFS